MTFKYIKNDLAVERYFHRFKLICCSTLLFIRSSMGTFLSIFLRVCLIVCLSLCLYLCVLYIHRQCKIEIMGRHIIKKRKCICP